MRGTHRRWWERSIQAVPAAIATIRSAGSACVLHDLPMVANKLRYRRGGIPPKWLFPKIPGGVRLAGEKAIRDYLSNHDLSHVVSGEAQPRCVRYGASAIKCCYAVFEC